MDAIRQTIPDLARYFSLLPAAGVGARMAADCPKQYLPLAGRPMLWHAIQAFERAAAITRTYVVLAPDDDHWDRYDWSALTKLVVLRCGGNSRAASVANGLRAIAGQVADADWLLVHDAARPCLSGTLLDKLITELAADEVGGILAVPVADTLKRQTPAGRIQETVAREGMWAAQTPQMFRYGLLRRALEQAGNQVTDESSAVEALGLSPKLVASDMSNLKITYAGDLDLAEWWLTHKAG
ncbi:MAG: 2-C-methyl-D-erythritol 4-phosphate cytidylyltransferase [Hydrogenophilales bacterium CG_4_8_14_3_um_filter_62_83]|nr:MAG: 2-C-methyl-D-erythritol 4-phosphate cytidylyltransferase [Hydrogenophilales bacterium CG15_BIG_FIL_POST_REV_8_21_14_020_62_31]PIW71774.1 MAG: 2-C-methyl-D-erythritol 4-phosphate cytidylyltransferase [Hydrogenophilales bacterium CG12_big_fil_rev_8_21_14_0_65_61_21]PIX00776.1 MAG: 2-C-methyl-D-erythritol 4-phosphate cytidylyltransferase [Hydrogenophilales bacterium CG_4_8_14_3_um_filter_62_83]